MKQSGIKTYSILDLIPQRPPMVCVDELIAIGAQTATTIFRIPAGHCFVANGKFTAAGLLENVAQTAAARAGYLALESDSDVSIGFIASFKNVVCNKMPEAESRIETKIEFVQTVLNMSIFTANVLLDRDELLSCEVRIFMQE